MEIQNWDIALESLLREETEKNNKPLTLVDIKRLAQNHVIRFDDIMVTVFELTLNGKWVYQDNAEIIPITREEVEHLTIAGRIKEEDVECYTGLWSPR